MRLVRVAAALGLATLLAPAALAGDAPKGAWDGCGVGTTVTMKTTMKMSIEGVPETTTQSRQTLVKVTDDAWVVKMETEVGGNWTGQEITIPRKAPGTDAKAPKPEDLGEDKVTVEGKEYVCKKQKATMNGIATVSWTSEAAGILKVESEVPGGGTSVWTVTALAKKATVAGKEVTCREATSVTKGGGTESTSVTLTSDAVPGGVVRTESKTQMGPATSTTVMEVTAFEVK